MSESCAARVAWRFCRRTGTTTRDGRAVCRTHAAMFDKYADTESGATALKRLWGWREDSDG